VRTLPFLAALAALPAPLLAQSAVEVQATPAQLQLNVGQKDRLFLSAYDADGNLLSTPTFTFAVAQAAIAKVEADGTVTALAPGSTQIEVRSGSGKATVTVNVTGTPAEAVARPAPQSTPQSAPQSTSAKADARQESEPPIVLPPGARLEATPARLRLIPRETAQVVVALTSDQSSGIGRTHVAWKSLAPDVATVTDSGVVQGISSGEAQLMATGPGGLTTAVTVTVSDDSIAVAPARLLLPPGAMDTLRVTVPAQDGRRITQGLRWQSTNAGIVKVNPDGIALGVVPGETVILLNAFGKLRPIPVTVHPRPDRLRIVPSPTVPIRLLPGGTADFELYALTADSLLIPEVDYRWQLADSAVAGFDPRTRRLTARAVGHTTLTMTAHAFDPMTWQVEVAAGTLTLARTRLRVGLGGQDSLTASIRDDQGRDLTPAPTFAFTSDRPDVVAVDSLGHLTGVAAGSATITARTPWGAEAAARVFVTEGLLLGVRTAAGADLAQLPADGGGTALPLRAGGASSQGVWSPDGTRVAFVGTEGGNSDIYVMDADGQNVTRLTDAAEADKDPAWSPDGGTIAFTAVRGSTSHIWAMNVDGTGVRALTLGVGLNHSPAFSRDGQRIAFISNRGGNSDLYEMDAEGGTQRPITQTPDQEQGAAYYANGDLAVVVDRPGRNDILRIRAGDGQRTMLLSLPGKVSAFAIAPDGATAVFTLAEPAADKKAPPVVTFRLKQFAPDQPLRTVPAAGEVLSASFQGSW